MKRSLIKVMLVALVAILLVASIVPVLYAQSNPTGTLSFSEIDENKITEGAKDTSGAASSVNRIIGAILTVVQVVGSGVAVIMLIVLAIKYISAAPSDKAEIKKHAVVYVVGAVVLFAASGIIGIVRKFAGNVNNGDAPKTNP